MKYRKKPVVVEAMQFTNYTKDQCFNFVTCNRVARRNENGEPELVIQTLDGDMVASLGDWIIKEPFEHSDRRYYPCKPDIFEKTYEPLQEDRDDK